MHSRKVPEHLCLLWHYSQLLRHGTNQHVHEQKNGLKKCGTYTLWNTTQPLKKNKDKILAFDIKWTNMEDFLLSEGSQAMKGRLCMSPLNIH